MGKVYLFAQVFDDRLILAVVVDGGGLPVVPLADLTLQGGVGALQHAHFLQVGGQAVVEVLHGVLLAARDGEAAPVAAAAAAAEGARQVKARAEAIGGVRHPDVGSACAAVDARAAPVARGPGHGGHGEGGIARAVHRHASSAWSRGEPVRTQGAVRERCSTGRPGGWTL